MDSKDLRIVFAGTPDFAAFHLKNLLLAEYNVVAAYTQPDRPAGRGKKLTPGPVKEIALSAGIPVFQPDSLKPREQQERLQTLRPDLMIVVAYGLLLPESVLTIPVHGCLNVHASLLPRWRGAAPIERAILAGDTKTGITIMQMDAGLDTGDILLTLETGIAPEDNSASITRRLEELGSRGLFICLEQLVTGQLAPVPQDDDTSTYAGKLQKEEALIHWDRPAREILKQINAFYPRSPAYCFLAGERIRLLSARVLETSPAATAGTLIAAGKTGLQVACGDGVLEVTEVQLPGKKALPVAALLNAHSQTFAPGVRLTSTPADE